MTDPPFSMDWEADSYRNRTRVEIDKRKLFSLGGSGEDKHGVGLDFGVAAVDFGAFIAGALLILERAGSQGDDNGEVAGKDAQLAV